MTGPLHVTTELMVLPTASAIVIRNAEPSDYWAIAVSKLCVSLITIQHWLLDHHANLRHCNSPICCSTPPRLRPSSVVHPQNMHCEAFYPREPPGLMHTLLRLDRVLALAVSTPS